MRVNVWGTSEHRFPEDSKGVPEPEHNRPRKAEMCIEDGQPAGRERKEAERDNGEEDVAKIPQVGLTPAR